MDRADDLRPPVLGSLPPGKPSPASCFKPRLSEVIHVEDDDEWADLVRLWLATRGIRPHLASSRKQLLKFLKGKVPHPDCIILDVGLRDANGLDICRELKNDPARQMIPIVLLTARKGLKLRGLRYEALHVIEKSRKAGELFAAVMDSVLKQQERTRGIIELGDLRIEPGPGGECRVFLSRRWTATLSPAIHAIFRHLVENAGALVRSEILQSIAIGRSHHGSKAPDELSHSTLTTYICNLRSQLGDEAARRISCEAGQGYVYRAETGVPKPL